MSWAVPIYWRCPIVASAGAPGNHGKVIFGSGLQNLEIGGHKWETSDLASDYCIALIMDGKVEVHSLDELDLRW